MSIASIASTAARTSSGSATATAQAAATSLSGNLQEFLQMLMTQLQNQDPTSPMDANSFTTELVQFASVEQQINTNSSLGQLISLTQSDSMMQANSLVGHTVQVSASQMPLQNGSGSLTFKGPTAGTAQIAISTAAGVPVLNTTVKAAAGSNTWTWNGQDSQGNTVADGSYNVTVTGVGSNGTTTPLTFTVSGKVTGLQNTGTEVDLMLGTQPANITALQSVTG
jgi:flagellar basal-body rod modification protein FlgD